jgi:hypothetical protein
MKNLFIKCKEITIKTPARSGTKLPKINDVSLFNEKPKCQAIIYQSSVIIYQNSKNKNLIRDGK